MTAFTFEAARPDGTRVRGRLDAESAPAAAAVLSRRGLLPLAVDVATVRGAPRWRQASLRDLATVFHSLSALTTAGVPLATALSVTRSIATGPLAEAVGRVERRVREGSTLGSALETERGWFPAVTVGLVRAGERGTGLDRSLQQAAGQLENRAALSARVRAALAYPLLLATVGILSVLIILFVVVPRFAVMLADTQVALPAATRALLALSTFARGGGWAFALLIPIGAAALAALAHRRPLAWHGWLLGLPLVGPLRHALSTARCASTLAPLLESGTPVLAAVRVAQDTVADHAVADRLRRSGERIAQGASLAAAFEAERVLTPLGLRMAAIGDHAGRLPSLLSQAAHIEAELAEARLRALAALLEPAIVVAFALVVAFVAAALLQAVYSLRPV